MKATISDEDKKTLAGIDEILKIASEHPELWNDPNAPGLELEGQLEVALPKILQSPSTGMTIGEQTGDMVLLLGKLAKLQYNLSCKLFETIFGDKKAEHLWGVFERNDRSMLDFFSDLDGQNKMKLSEYILNY